MRITRRELNRLILENLLTENEKIIKFQKIIGMGDDKAKGDWKKDGTDEAWVAFLKKHNGTVKSSIPGVDIEKVGKNWKKNSGQYGSGLSGITEFANDVKELAAGDAAKKKEIEEKLKKEREEQAANKYLKFYDRIPAYGYNKNKGSLYGEYDLSNFRAKKVEVTSNRNYNDGAPINMKITIGDFAESQTFTLDVEIMNIEPKGATDKIHPRIVGGTNVENTVYKNKPYINELMSGNKSRETYVTYRGKKIYGKGIGYLVSKFYRANVDKIKKGAQQLASSKNKNV